MSQIVPLQKSQHLFRTLPKAQQHQEPDPEAGEGDWQEGGDQEGDDQEGDDDGDEGDWQEGDDWQEEDDRWDAHVGKGDWNPNAGACNAAVRTGNSRKKAEKNKQMRKQVK